MYNRRDYRGIVAGLLLALAVTAAAQAADGVFGAGDAVVVNEGVLELLPVPPGEPVHTHTTRIELDGDSLADGWAMLRQCHRHLDPVGSAQIVYRPDGIRSLAVLSSSGIGRARVDGPSVQLEDVGADAELCVQAESRVVHSLPGGRFMVRNGPFMRRFLDGYYPMHVTLMIVLPPGRWAMERSVPPAQPGFSVSEADDRVQADAWFTGRLETEFYFRPADNR